MLLIRQRGPEAGLEPDPNGYVWPGRSWQRPVTGKSVYKYLTETMRVKATIDGFRTSLRTWAGDETYFDRVTSELALGHKAGSAVELAYRRVTSWRKGECLCRDGPTTAKADRAAGRAKGRVTGWLLP